MVGWPAEKRTLCGHQVPRQPRGRPLLLGHQQAAGQTGTAGAPCVLLGFGAAFPGPAASLSPALTYVNRLRDLPVLLAGSWFARGKHQSLPTLEGPVCVRERDPGRCTPVMDCWVGGRFALPRPLDLCLSGAAVLQRMENRWRQCAERVRSGSEPRTKSPFILGPSWEASLGTRF